MVQDGFSVLVFDMARTGDPDGERVLEGFATVEAARAYAEARVRCSVEELRTPGQTPGQLRSLWHIYGEDCAVLGDAWKGREQLDLYIALPASPSERDWAVLTPARKRFHAAVLVSDAGGDSVWAGGYLRRYTKPDRDALLEIYRADAVAAFARRGIADAAPVSVNVAHLFELPDPPRPPAGAALRNWKVSVDFVCHDIKFGGGNSGVFAWPQEPAGAELEAMIRLLLADACALRGDGPAWAEHCDVLRSSVTETADAPDYDFD